MTSSQNCWKTQSDSTNSGGNDIMQNISCVSGSEYIFLAITKKKAQEYGIENPTDIEIKATNSGILINRKSACSCEPTADLDEEFT